MQNVKITATDSQRNYAIIKKSIFFGHFNKTLDNIFSPLKPPFRANVNVIFTAITLNNSSFTKWAHYQELHRVTKFYKLQVRCFLTGRCRVRVIQQSILKMKNKVFLENDGHIKTSSGAHFQLLNNRRSIALERFWSTLTATILVFLIGLAVVLAVTIRICFKRL